MKKFLDLATVTALIVVLAVALRHYEVNKEVGDIIKTVAIKFVPWIDNVIFS
jgi:hypothetical protein